MVFAAATIVGAWLRLDQLVSQVLIDDEWHAIHQMLYRTPQVMFFDFGFADYSIPLGILDWYVAHGWGISEIAMRLPMVACGLATLVASLLVHDTPTDVVAYGALGVAALGAWAIVDAAFSSARSGAGARLRTRPALHPR